MPETAAIDTAILQVLKADVALAALAPDGIWWEWASQGARRFVVVSFAAPGEDIPGFGGTAMEVRRYAIQTAFRDTDPVTAAAAAARIQELLHRVPLVIPEYVWMETARTQPIRRTDPDPSDNTVLWQHHGGVYLVVAAPNPSPVLL